MGWLDRRWEFLRSVDLSRRAEASFPERMFHPHSRHIMDLLHALTTFTRIVETGSFSAVARESNASHSAVTRLIGQLEEHFGVRLFHRTTRHLSLTEDGQDLLGHARHLIELADEIAATMSSQRRKPTGLVRLGIPSSTARLLVPRLRDFLGQHPGLSIELAVSDQVDNLVEERLDLAVRYGAVNDASLVVRSIGTMRRIAVAAPAYLERHGAPATPADLAGHACVIHDRGPDSARWNFCGPDGPTQVRVSGALVANNSELVRQAVLEGYGIACLSELSVGDDIRSARLCRVLAEYAIERRPVSIVYPSRRHLAPRTRAVIDFLVDQFRNIEPKLARHQTGADGTSGA